MLSAIIMSGTFDYTKYRYSVYGVTNSYNAALTAKLQLNMPKQWIIACSGNYATPTVVPTMKTSDYLGFNAVAVQPLCRVYQLSRNWAICMLHITSDARKTSLWKRWECLQRNKIGVLGCKS